jgi:hypothetical protein
MTISACFKHARNCISQVNARMIGTSETGANGSPCMPANIHNHIHTGINCYP